MKSKLKFNAAVPGRSFAKSKVNVSQSPATVVELKVSTERVGSFLSSIFNRTGIPATGDHVLTVIVVASAVKGMFEANPVWNGGSTVLSKAVTVTPAKVAAVSDLTNSTTVLLASVGSTVITEASAPPKDAMSYSTVGSLNVTGKSI